VAAVPIYFWDSCVFIRYLSGTQGDPVFDDISRIIDDARLGKFRILFSTLIFTEVRPRYAKMGGYLSVRQFFQELGNAFEPVEPNPNIMLMAGELRDAQATNPSDQKLDPEKVRAISTPDAIHLMSAVYVRDVLGVSNVVFHTLDNGKGKNWEGRCVPLLTFENWFPMETRTPRVDEVCRLERKRPVHPVPTLMGLLQSTRPVDLASRNVFLPGGRPPALPSSQS